jgi:hypothetical protein
MIGLGVGAYRLIGLDPDQLSLQAPFPEGLAAPMAVQATKRDHRCGVSRPTEDGLAGIAPKLRQSRFKYSATPFAAAILSDRHLASYNLGGLDNRWPRQCAKGIVLGGVELSAESGICIQDGLSSWCWRREVGLYAQPGRNPFDHRCGFLVVIRCIISREIGDELVVNEIFRDQRDPIVDCGGFFSNVPDSKRDAQLERHVESRKVFCALALKAG